MSATKELLAAIEQAQVETDLTLREVVTSFLILSNLAWSTGIDQPVWSPDQEWLDATKADLTMLEWALAELQAAKNAQVSVNN